YNCGYPSCNHTFQYPSQLRSHSLVHSKEKPFQCAFILPNGHACIASYTTRNRLKIHERTHTGEKPYFCTRDSCTYRSVQKCTLDAHLILAHGTEEER
ncbi:hypothetical protein BC830DRAFT_1044779, partial [Chytriomyces sp. MP71]